MTPEPTLKEQVLKLCPFCGGAARLINAVEAGNEGAVVVECGKCYASTACVFGIKQDPTQRVIDLWNSRSADLERAAQQRGTRDARILTLRSAEKTKWKGFK